MSSKGSLGFQLLQWLLRAVQFSCSIAILGIFAYFASTLHIHDLGVPRWIRAVLGITGGAAIFTFVAMLLLCFLAGHPFVAAVATFFDLVFLGAFIYVAYASRGGARSCSGLVNTPFGTGSAGNRPNESSGVIRLPTYGMACRLQKACEALAIIAL